MAQRTDSPALKGAPALNGQTRRWQVAPPTPEADARALGPLPPIVAHLLYRRGLRGPAETSDFLNATEALFEDPATLPDVGPAMKRIAAAKRSWEPVAVYGDFDADGDVDLLDVAAFGRCFTGLGEPLGPGCAPGDFDENGSVDALDVALFGAGLTGP